MTIKEVLEHKWLINKASSSKVMEKRKSINLGGGSTFQVYTNTTVDGEKTVSKK
jgi:hypothetical protein